MDIQFVMILGFLKKTSTYVKIRNLFHNFQLWQNHIVTKVQIVFQNKKTKPQKRLRCLCFANAPFCEINPHK
ncbi:hypothetical protein COJ86_28580 [Bacillus cereus]|nr:hypothetical protein COJ86_28580 [Bacillus cereus]